MTGTLRTRLAKLERVVCDTTGGRCPTCQGEPQAVFLVMHELALDRKSIRATGDVYFADQSIGKFTEDRHDPRCLGCGAKARKALVMYTPGVGPERTGKKLVSA